MVAAGSDGQAVLLSTLRGKQSLAPGASALNRPHSASNVKTVGTRQNQERYGAVNRISTIKDKNSILTFGSTRQWTGSRSSPAIAFPKAIRSTFAEDAMHRKARDVTHYVRSQRTFPRTGVLRYLSPTERPAFSREGYCSGTAPKVKGESKKLDIDLYSSGKMNSPIESGAPGQNSCQENRHTQIGEEVILSGLAQTMAKTSAVKRDEVHLNERNSNLIIPFEGDMQTLDQLTSIPGHVILSGFSAPLHRAAIASKGDKGSERTVAARVAALERRKALGEVVHFLETDGQSTQLGGLGAGFDSLGSPPGAAGSVVDDATVSTCFVSLGVKAPDTNVADASSTRTATGILETNTSTELAESTLVGSIRNEKATVSLPSPQPTDPDPDSRPNSKDLSLSHPLG